MSQFPPDSPATPPVEPASPGVPPVLRPHRGVMILTFGIIGLATNVLGCGCCIAFVPIGLVFNILAWIMGNNDLRAMRAGEMDPAGQGQTNAGKICGMIGVGVAVLSVLVTIAMIVFQVGIGGMNRWQGGGW